MTLGTAAAGIVKPGDGTYNIGFNDGDETQFDVYDLAELLDVWIEFCAENSIQTNSVDYVERVEVMKKKVRHIDKYEGECEYSYRHEPFCNGGHNCIHSDAEKEIVDGKEVGFCYAFSCPLAPCADEEAFKDAGEDLNEYEEDMYVVLYEEDK